MRAVVFFLLISTVSSAWGGELVLRAERSSSTGRESAALSFHFEKPGKPERADYALNSNFIERPDGSGRVALGQFSSPISPGLKLDFDEVLLLKDRLRPAKAEGAPEEAGSPHATRVWIDDSELEPESVEARAALSILEKARTRARWMASESTIVSKSDGKFWSEHGGKKQELSGCRPSGSGYRCKVPEAGVAYLKAEESSQ